MHFLSPAQCRAARGLLDWSQPDLAQKCGMHVQTICAFEKEMSTPTKTTLEKITKAFENFGVEFIRDGGVRNRSLKTTTLRGKSAYKDFLSLVAEVAKNQGGEFCVSNVDERFFADRVTREEGLEYRAKMEQASYAFNFKILVKENDYNFLASRYAKYKWLPKEHFHSVPFYAFGDYLAFIIFDTQTIIHVINNPEIASAQRTQFNFVWERAKKPPKKNKS